MVAIDKFRNQDDCFVLLTNPQTLGEGISFHHVCNQAIYLDRTYNAGQYLQSLDRIHRLGLPKDTKTFIYLLTTENSIDNRKKITNINRLILSNKILFNLLDANIINKAKFFYAASSEVFGEPTEYPQNENTAFKPRSLYGLIKVTGVHLVRYYRKYHGLFACSGFLYNHESYLRKNIFLIKEVVNQAFQIKRNKRKFFKINDPYVYRDWSDARDFVSGFWKILSYKSPDDYVVSSSKSRNVLEVMKTVCEILNINLSDHMQIRKLKNDKKKIFLVGNNTKLKKIGWKPKITFRNMILDIINSKKK